MSIPDFIDGYHLPPGEHIASLDEVKQRFALSSPSRINSWESFEMILSRFRHLGITPRVIIIDGSFVTGRAETGDVDCAVLVDAQKIRNCIANPRINGHDLNGIIMILNDPDLIRDVFGVHVFVVENETDLAAWSSFFRAGADNGLRSPDPQRDPNWVKEPNEKGIIRVEF